MNEEVTAYVTKYALSSGIFRITGHVINSKMFCYKMPGCYSEIANSKYWHITEREALERAEEMRVSKIKSLKKQIEKLEKLTF